MRTRRCEEPEEVIVLVLDFDDVPRGATRSIGHCITSWLQNVSPATGVLSLYSDDFPSTDTRLAAPWMYSKNHWYLEVSPTRSGSLPPMAMPAFTSTICPDSMGFEEWPIVDSRGNKRNDGWIDFDQSHQHMPDLKWRIVACLPLRVIRERDINTRRLINEILSECGTLPECVGGFVTVEDAKEVIDGLLFTGMTTTPSRYWDMQEWAYAHEGPGRFLLARDVFWGNYFGPRFLAKHDPDGSLRRQFVEYSDGDDEDNEAQGLTHFILNTKSGGAFFMLGERPEEYSITHLAGRGFSEASGLALWLRRELRKRGALL